MQIHTDKLIVKCLLDYLPYQSHKYIVNFSLTWSGGGHDSLMVHTSFKGGKRKKKLGIISLFIRGKAEMKLFSFSSTSPTLVMTDPPVSQSEFRALQSPCCFSCCCCCCCFITCEVHLLSLTSMLYILFKIISQYHCIFM